MRLPGFAGGSYVTESTYAAGERCVNLMPNPYPFGNKTRMALECTPGFVTFATMPKSPGRGIFSQGGRCHAVFGDSLYEIDANGTVTERGSVAVDGNPAHIGTLGDLSNELFVASGGRLDVLNLATNVYTPNVVSTINMVGDLDGFAVGLDQTTNTMRISDNGDALTWDPTQNAQRAAASDPWLAMIIVAREIFLLGEKTGEVWYNAGRSPFPLAQRVGALFEVGIVAPFSLSRFGGSFAWLGRSATGIGGVYRMNGYTPEEISTPAIRKAIQDYQDRGDISNALGWSYERDRHSFYVLEFPYENRTWVYDSLTDLWHERGYWEPLANDFLAYRARFHAVAFGKNLVCDGSGDKVYRLSSQVYTDVGGALCRRMRRTPHLSNENERLFFTSAELECDRGVGLAVAEGVDGHDPKVTLRYSNDGGNTWRSGRDRSLGKRGKYRTRVRWNGLGSGRDRVWELASSDPVAHRWLDFYVK